MKSLESKALTHSVLPIRKVLVAVNLSDHSEATATYAAQIAKHFDASLTIVFVYEPVSLCEYACESTYTLLEDQRSDLQKMLDELTHRIEKIGLVCKSAFLIGKPAGQILALARDTGADLIVIASHHLTLLERMFELDKAVKIMHQAPCPVLIYQEKQMTDGRRGHRDFGVARGARAAQNAVNETELS